MAHVWHLLHAAYEVGGWPALVGGLIGGAILVSGADISSPAGYCVGLATCPQVLDGVKLLAAAGESLGGVIVGCVAGGLLNVAVTGKLKPGES
jgi:hypothetical protein